MEIAPNIHLIPGTVGARPLQLFLLRGDKHTVLLDTGTAEDPDKFVFPYLKSMGLEPGAIDLVINTHADADHSGGNAALKRAVPNAALTCGQADHMFICDPAVMIDRRYTAYRAEHDIGPDEAVHNWFVEMLGHRQEIDWTWCGGEIIQLSADWHVEILATPGHSPGHLTIFDPSSRTALMGDAVHGSIGRDALGNLTFPAYIELESYVQTVALVRSLDLNTLAGCHWDVMRGTEINSFLDASLDYVRQLDEVLLAELGKTRDGATLRELIRAGGARLAGGRSASELELVYTFAANMEYLVANARVIKDVSARPVRYYLPERDRQV